MSPVLIEQFYPKSFDDIRKVKKALRQCKDEWLEQKKGKNDQWVPYMGHNTIRQILDYAVDGITYWDFGILEQWKEEVYSLNKQTKQWMFDGYVYHVKGYMFIPGIGYREQFGCKIAVGGVNNQDSAYKAAASNCFAKCASMFGVGEEIYAKIKVDMEAIEEDQQYAQLQQNPNYMIQNSVANNPWSQYPTGAQQQVYAQWPQGNPSSQGVMPNQWPTHSSANEQKDLNQVIQEVDQAMQNGLIQTPFDEPTTYQANQQAYQAQSQQAGTPQSYQAEVKQYGAPVQTTQGEAKQENNQQQSPINPWQEQGVIAELQRYQAHKNRLNITDDQQMISYLRDYFQDENANLQYLTPENIKGFNDYLDKILV